MKSLLILCLLLASCATIPDGVQPVTGFEVERYMGTWYEIARIDNQNEGALVRVNAEYRLLPDGKIEVIYRGFNVRSNSWSSLKANAWFEGSKEVASLKISFSTPFPGNYNVLVLGSGYRYALVSGSTLDDLWILSRDPEFDKAIVDGLVAQAKTWGFNVSKLIIVDQKSLVK